jgi:hypothetical protein
MNPQPINDSQSDVKEPRSVAVSSIVPFLPFIFAILEFLAIATVVVNLIAEFRGSDAADSDTSFSPVLTEFMLYAPALLGFITGIFAIARSSRYHAGPRVLAVIGTAFCGAVVIFPLAAFCFPHWW